jgi:hypothetical protein
MGGATKCETSTRTATLAFIKSTLAGRKGFMIYLRIIGILLAIVLALVGILIVQNLPGMKPDGEPGWKFFGAVMFGGIAIFGALIGLVSNIAKVLRDSEEYKPPPIKFTPPIIKCDPPPTRGARQHHGPSSYLALPEPPKDKTSNSHKSNK